jgi:hypothetical protein
VRSIDSPKNPPAKAFDRPYAEGIFIGHTPKALTNFSPRLELATTLGSRPIKSELTL